MYYCVQVQWWDLREPHIWLMKWRHRVEVCVNVSVVETQDSTAGMSNKTLEFVRLVKIC